MLDRYSRRTGVKKGHLIEEALRSYLVAHELPLDVVIPSTVVLNASSSVRQLRGQKPNAALRRLMSR